MAQNNALRSEEVMNPQLKEEDANLQGGNDIFAQFMSEDAGEDKSREDIIKELIASGNAKLLRGLSVKNVVATEFETEGGSHTLLTFVIKEFVIGDTHDPNEVDAFGQPVVKLGKTHNVQTSSFAVAGIMKDSPKQAIFATDVVDSPKTANMLYAGGNIDVLLQFVPKDEEYVNPFASNPKPVTFNRNKMIHHIVALSMGEVGQDMYRTRLMK